MASKNNWMRLDLDFWRDPKVFALAKDKGEAYVARWLKLVCLAQREHGRLDLSKPSIRAWVEAESGMKGKSLDATISACLEAGLFDMGMWDEYGVVTSSRMAEEADMAYSKKERAVAAARARWEKTDED